MTYRSDSHKRDIGERLAGRVFHDIAARDFIDVPWGGKGRVIGRMKQRALAEASALMLYRKRIRLRIAYQSLALPEQGGEFCLLVSDAIGDPLLICRARHSSSLLL